MAKVKCFFCGKMFDREKEEFVKPTTRRYAHKSCAEEAEQNKSQEEKDKEELEAYIKNLFGLDNLTAKIRKQIKAYREENKYSYSGILKTLKYFFEIKNNPIEKANGGIGIVSWVWADARKYWKSLEEALKVNEQVQIDQYLKPVKKVYILPPKRETMRQTRKLFNFLDEERINE